MSGLSPAPLNRILVGFDGRQGSNDALRLGILLAEAAGAELVVAAIYPDAEASGEQGHGSGSRLVARDEFFDTAFAAARSQLASAPFEVRPAVDRVARGLHRLAESEPADLIVLGSTAGATLGHVRAGATVMPLLNGAPCAVAIAPHGLALDRRPIGRIRVVWDGSAESRSALALAGALAAAATTRIELIATDADEAQRAELERAAAGPLVPEAVDVEVTASPGGADPVLALTHGAAGSDLLVIGSRDYGPAGHVVIGRTATAIVADAPCSVLIVPRVAAGRDPGTLWADARARRGSIHGASLHSDAG